nr:MAG TPA: hypothetical protein [Caudoviricetes sp.]
MPERKTDRNHPDSEIAEGEVLFLIAESEECR